MPSQADAAQQGQAFTSEGFDLDAIPAKSRDDDVVLEVGGGFTTANASSGPSSKTAEAKKKQDELDEVIARAEAAKQRGNEAFQSKMYAQAYDLYTEAMEHVPTNEERGEKTGKQLLALQQEHLEKVKEHRMKRHQRQQDKRRRRDEADRLSRTNNDANKNDTSNDNDDDEEEEEEDLPPFQPPPHVYGTKLAVYYSNRAASLLHLQRYEEAETDATISILYNPSFVKPYIRRMTARENLDQIEEALEDARTAQQIDPSNRQIRQHVTRLEKEQAERMEKLKEETMGKLKDLGNSFLGNFGLSLDNFQATKDPNTGSYNIAFNNNPGQK